MHLLEALLACIHFLVLLGHYALRTSHYIGSRIFVLVEAMARTLLVAMQETIKLGNDLYEFLCQFYAAISNVMLSTQVSVETNVKIFATVILEGLMTVLDIFVDIVSTLIDEKSVWNGFWQIIDKASYSLATIFDTLIRVPYTAITCTIGECHRIESKSLPWLMWLFNIITVAVLVVIVRNSNKIVEFVKLLCNELRLFWIRIRCNSRPSNAVDATSFSGAHIRCNQEQWNRSTGHGYFFNSEDVLVAHSCVICHERRKCVLLMPCRHLCLCEQCSEYMVLEGLQKNCPLCRAPVLQFLSVYV